MTHNKNHAVRTVYEQPLSISHCDHVRSTSLMVISAATSTDATCCEKVKACRTSAQLWIQSWEVPKCLPQTAIESSLVGLYGCNCAYREQRKILWRNVLVLWSYVHRFFCYQALITPLWTSLVKGVKIQLRLLLVSLLQCSEDWLTTELKDFCVFSTLLSYWKRKLNVPGSHQLY